MHWKWDFSWSEMGNKKGAQHL
ncbi:unnamed protein product [Spirodela intermedia]|uniref:Uncharacterized protein n=2 Tax=Spirodela intermedia TaxID=51605 RepID=A0A7I8J2A5_SPIIN|nr:unnamed protein product [Spirodela intermedia]CAA6664346.1 unnamed protein product [Spirodela intermedia]CAA7400930.1 unnamed protein product [Spirodela intermedia]